MERSGTYFSSDDISNFILRVTIWRAGSNAALPHLINAYSDAESQPKDSIVIKWQEKIQCANNEDSFRVVDSTSHEVRLDKAMYTYVEGEHPEVEIIKRYPVIWNRYLDSIDRQSVKEMVENYRIKPPERLICTPLMSVQTMYVMFRYFNNGSIENAIICYCEYFKDAKVLVIYPDFSREGVPYKLLKENGGHPLYEYYIYHASLDATLTDKLREISMLNEVYAHRMKSIEQAVGCSFVCPQDQDFAIYVMLDISEIKCFGSGPFILEYQVTLPQDWTPDASCRLKGRSQLCLAKQLGEGYVANINMPVEFKLSFRQLEEQHPTGGRDWPTVAFSVKTVDFWKITRVEGYGRLCLPQNPGTHQMSVSIWRPLENSTHNLARYFLGSHFELNNSDIMGYSRDSRAASQYGFRTEPGGSILVDINVMMQSARAVQESGCVNKLVGLETAKLATLTHSINAVVSAFNRARQRLKEMKVEAGITGRSKPPEEDA